MWRTFPTGSGDNTVSVAKIIEESAELLREKYLAWIYRLGEAKIGSKRVIDHLVLRQGFSYWWTTLLAQKCNYSKSPHINEAMRLLALSQWVDSCSRPVTLLSIATDNKALVSCLRLWCSARGISLSQGVTRPKSVSVLNRLYERLTHTLRAISWLPWHLFSTWPLKGIGLKEWQESQGKVTFFSYLINFSASSSEQGRFESNYWAHLPGMFDADGMQTNWLHLYLPSETVRTTKRAAALIKGFNKVEKGSRHHVTLHTFMNTRVVLRTLCDWVRMTIRGWSLSSQLAKLNDPEAYLWPLYSQDWLKSSLGVEAIATALNFNLMQSALALLPKQTQGIYLQENQPWEFGLIYAWQTYGHGALIGSSHSTVRFWDLRYFYDPRSYLRNCSCALPLPTLVAVTSPLMHRTYIEGGYPCKELVEVEALRYLYLSDRENRVKSTKKQSRCPIRLLVLGDYWPSSTQQQMTLLVHAMPSLPQITIVVKPHPACPIDPLDYPTVDMTLTTETISVALEHCDIVYTSNMTSAALDAYCSGLPVVSALDPRGLNLSPIRGCPSAAFASTPKELIEAIIHFGKSPPLTVKQDEFFLLDLSLPRWKKLMQLDGG